jgi:3-hydroxyisobutyrate dehydrogenase
MSEMRHIGFIGIGNMGSRMTANLVRKGRAVTVFDVEFERARKFADEHQARAANRLADLGGSDVVITMLPTGREVREAMLEMEGGGLAPHLRRGTILIDMSSADPVGTRELGKELAARGIALVDAPVSGGIEGARDATLAIMIGGEPATIAAVKPVLADLGNRLFEVGGPGCGHAMKCLNNFVAGANFAAVSEAVTVGREFGLDPALMIDIINVSTGRSFVSEMGMKKHVITGAFATGFTAGLLAKDVNIAAELAAQIGVDAPVGRMARDMWAEARDAVGPAQDHTRAAVYWDSKATGKV